MWAMLLLAALLLAAGAPAPKPPARLLAPEAVRKARVPDAEEGTASLFAVASPDVVAALGGLVPEQGAWVEYGVRRRGREEARVRLSVLPPAMPEGRYWLEVASAGLGGVPVAARILVKGDPSRPANVERMLVYVAGQAALELPVDEAEGVFGSAAPPQSGARIERLGKARVTTRGGTYEAERLRVTRGKESTQVWKAAGVPLLPLVRSESKEQTVELLGSARTGAHSVFPAEPDLPADARP